MGRRWLQIRYFFGVKSTKKKLCLHFNLRRGQRKYELMVVLSEFRIGMAGLRRGELWGPIFALQLHSWREVTIRQNKFSSSSLDYKNGSLSVYSTCAGTAIDMHMKSLNVLKILVRWNGNVEIVIIQSLAILIILCFPLTVDCYNVLTRNSYHFTTAR